MRVQSKILLLAVLLTVTDTVIAKTSTIQRKQRLNDHWQFVENDSDFTKANTVTLPH